MDLPGKMDSLCRLLIGFSTSWSLLGHSLRPDGEVELKSRATYVATGALLK